MSLHFQPWLIHHHFIAHPPFFVGLGLNTLLFYRVRVGLNPSNFALRDFAGRPEIFIKNWEYYRVNCIYNAITPRLIQYWSLQATRGTTSCWRFSNRCTSMAVWKDSTILPWHETSIVIHIVINSIRRRVLVLLMQTILASNKVLFMKNLLFIQFLL